MRIIYIILIILLFELFNCYVVAQQETDTNRTGTTIMIDTNKIDTNKVDTNKIQKDTNTYYIFSNYRGSSLDFNDNINYKEIPTYNYFFITDILTQYLPSNPLFTTIAGNHSAFSILGAMPNENTCLLNNVPITDFYGNANLDYISPEFANNIEILYGSNAAIRTGKSGMAVNIQPFIYNTSKPYSKIWYAQGDNKLIGIDGIYSQNFLPNWNITGGFKRVSSNSYYQNSFVDMWNARLMLSFQQSTNSTFSLLYHFTNFYTGDFGGILPEDYNTNNNAANQVHSKYTSLSDRQYRTDVIFSHSYHSVDTNLIINSNLFFNHLENGIYYKTDSIFLKIDSSGKNIASVYNYGLISNIQYHLSKEFNINAGLEFTSNNIPNAILSNEYNGLGYNIYAENLLKFNSTNISFGGRYGMKYKEDVFAFGTNINQKITENISIFGDVSYLKNFEILLNTANNNQYENEKHFLGIVGCNYDSVGAINVFYRHITQSIPILGELLPSKYSLFGGIIKANIKLPYNFKTTLLLSSYIDGGADDIEDGHSLYPLNNYLNLSLDYTYTKNTSTIIFGVSGTLLNAGHKYYFNPLTKNYTRTDLDEAGFDGISAYIKAKLGNCYLRASFKNILGLDYSYLAYYPMLKQEFCLSLTWAFPN